MKNKNLKRSLHRGIVFAFSGIIFLLISIFSDTKLNGIFYGFAGAGVSLGLIWLHQYFHWSSPKHAKEYEELLEQENIEQNDELKEKLDDKSGQYTYIWSIIIAGIAAMVFCVLGALRIIRDYIPIVLYLIGYIFLLMIMKKRFYDQLMKKYQ